MPRYGILGLAAPSRRRGGSLTILDPPANTYRMAQAKRTARSQPDEPTLVAGGARRTIMLALWLTSFIPLMVVGYSLYAYLLPLLDHTRRIRDLPWLQALLVFTGLLMAVGGLLDLGPDARAPAPRAGRSRARAAPERPAAAARREAGRRRRPAALLLPHARAHRAAGGGPRPLRHAARRRLPGARVHQRAAQGVLLQGRGDRPLQPPLLLDPARGRGLPLPPLQPPRLGGAPRPRRLQGGQRRARPRRGRRDAAGHGRDPPAALARHQRHLPLRRRRVRRPAGRDVQGGRPALRGPHPLRAVLVPVRPPPAPHRELRHRLAARGRGAHARTTSSGPPTRRSTRPSAPARTASRSTRTSAWRSRSRAEAKVE